MLDINTATLVGLFTSCVLYGLYVCLFFASLFILVSRRSNGHQNGVLLASSIVLFIIITFMLGLSFSNVLDAFVYRSYGNPAAFLEVPFFWKSLTLQVLGLFICLFADSILLYRCWLIWGQSWQPMVPTGVLFLASIAMFIFTVVELSRTALYLPSDAPKLYHGLDAFLVLTLVQNVLVTTLIAYRLWRADLAVAAYRSASTLLPVIWIIIESGLLYSATLLVFLVANFVDPWVSVIMSAMLCSMIGITFSSIIVRCGYGSWKHTIQTDPSSHNMQPIPINISRQTDVEIQAEGSLRTGGRSVSTESFKRDPTLKESTFGKYSV
ncbi:hypothetical protein CALCODRAFT_149740 [Calocera cornea HHB12733]|uniref:Uncharacterized protein n=1 Tax=Calocera cornea HHB12733 TaxID=1353952 RepID=A0A165I3Q5_9BASI|nr:hypothetical protein CALCODRAFT_149740 [Calocera cornea HHB12733]